MDRANQNQIELTFLFWEYPELFINHILRLKFSLYVLPYYGQLGCHNKWKNNAYYYMYLMTGNDLWCLEGILLDPLSAHCLCCKMKFHYFYILSSSRGWLYFGNFDPGHSFLFILKYLFPRGIPCNRTHGSKCINKSSLSCFSYSLVHLCWTFLFQYMCSYNHFNRQVIFMCNFL